MLAEQANKQMLENILRKDLGTWREGVSIYVNAIESLQWLYNRCLQYKDEVEGLNQQIRDQIVVIGALEDELALLYGQESLDTCGICKGLGYTARERNGLVVRTTCQCANEISEET